jgi:hypothetical protein
MNPNLTEFESKSLQKRPKGSLILERRANKAKAQTYEKDQKAAVVRRDGAHTCRLVPNCPEKTRHETAHIDGKGMGGDHGIRSHAANMIRGCIFHHQGAWSLHSGDLRVDCLTELGANGPVEVYGTDSTGAWYLVKREIRCGELERD